MSDIALKILIVSLPYGLFLLFCASYISSSVKFKLRDKTFQHKDRVGTAYRVSCYKLTFFLTLLRAPLWFAIGPDYLVWTKEFVGMMFKDISLVAQAIPSSYLTFPVLLICNAILAIVSTFAAYLFMLNSRQHRVLE